MNESPTIREIYRAGKKFWQDQKNQDPYLGHLLQMDISQAEFSQYRLRLALQNIYRDIINPVRITDIGTQLLENIVPFVGSYGPSSLGGFALGLKDILYKGMTTHKNIGTDQSLSGVYFGKIWLPEIEKHIIVELQQKHVDDGHYTFGSLKQPYDIVEGCFISNPVIHHRIFEYPFKTLYLLYRFIHFYSENSHKVILYKHGLSDLFATADLRKMDALKTELLQQAHDVVNKSLLVLDTQDRFEIPTLKLDQAQEIMDFVYTELSNMLLVPQSKIRGLAPQGMNATGEYDEINYGRTLEGFRNSYLYPVLKELKVDFSTENYDSATKMKMLQDFGAHYPQLKEAGLDEMVRQELYTLLGIPYEAK